jgi:hypothetical protein
MKRLIFALGFLGLIVVLSAKAEDEECEILFVEKGDYP